MGRPLSITETFYVDDNLAETASFSMVPARYMKTYHGNNRHGRVGLKAKANVGTGLSDAMNPSLLVDGEL